jgi:lysophospholipase L1-like esterase
MRLGLRSGGRRYAANPSPPAVAAPPTMRRRLVRGACRCAAAAAVATPLFIAQQYYTLRSAYRPLERPPRTPVDGLEDSFFSEGETHSSAVDDGGREEESCRLVIIGDSLVCGIGSDRSGAAALCGQVAQDIAMDRRKRVRWSSFGLDGGCAKSIRSMVPAISNDLLTREGEQRGELIVLLIVGLNDYKNVVSGPGSDEFGKNLEELVSCINSATGQQAKIFMPLLPFDAVPLLQKYYLAAPIVKGWIHSYEDKKRALSHKIRNVTCCDNYTAEECAELGRLNMWSTDGVHPNLAGYKVMGSIMTRRILMDRGKVAKRVDEEWKRLQAEWQRWQYAASEANTR